MAESEELIVLEPHASGRRYLRELWNYRELFLVLAQRDLQVRYKHAFFGVAWALVRPLTTTLVFAFAFGHIAQLPSQGVPYPLFVLAGALPWQLFSSSLTEGGSSVIANSHIVSKTYFPRLIVPASTLLVSLLDFAISLLVLLGTMLWYQVSFTPRMALAPLFVGLTLLVSLGASLWISALNVRFRDVRHVVPFLVQFGLFVSPVGYGTGVVPAWLQTVYRFNPLVAPIDGMRWCLFGIAPRSFQVSLTTSLVAGGALLVTGYLYFRKTETTFADII